MAANFGLIPHAAEGDPDIFAPKAARDRICNRGLADTRRADQTDDLALYRIGEFAHGKNFENPFLTFFKP